MAEGGQQPSTPRASPPKAVVDTSPLLNSLEQNKESLKVKLMLRRPLDQLVAQGIMPSRKAPAAFHDQRRQLERAKTGDMLKAKIQQRPPRQELERRHILESDPGHVDPSLAEKQRMLKKARLADQLNDQLSHRPGPLELIQKNILHTEEPIEHMVKAGRIPYKATCEGNLNRPQHPSVYVNPEDDSQSSEDNLVSPGPSDVLETAAKSAGIVVSLIPATEGTVVVTTSATPVFNKDSASEIVFTPLIHHRTASSPASLVSSTSTLSPLSSIASPVPSVVSQPATPVPPPLPTNSYTPRSIQSPGKSDAPGKDKNRKKSKSKSAPKTRTIKFHEYKGPPSAQKSSINSANASGESSYDLLLQQQTLLLQFQLQLQHKYPQIILPASQKNQQQQESNGNTVSNPLPSPSTSTSTQNSDSCNSCRLVGRLEDMKVSDLKAELKRRNLPVSGSKPQLIERLKPFTSSSDSSNQSSHIDSSVKSPGDDSQHNSPIHNDIGSPHMAEETELMDVSSPLSPLPQPVQVQAHIVKAEPHDFNEDLVKKQQRKIEELQRELTLSQMKLEAATRAEPKAQLIALQKHLARQQQQQMAEQIQLQAFKVRQAEEQQRLQQQQHVAFQNQKNLGGGILLNSADASLVLNQLVQGNKKILNGHNRANSLPNFLNSLVTPVITAPEIKTEFEEDIKPPPLYEEVIIKKEKNNVKSQIVDDVLEILIENGELPPSAANDPATPDSVGTRIVEPVFPNTQTHNQQAEQHQQQQQVDANSPEAVLGLDASDFLEDTLEYMDINQLAIDWGQQGNDNVQNNNDQILMDTDDWLESLLPSEILVSKEGFYSKPVRCKFIRTNWEVHFTSKY
ncbi:hypothetical protein AMK59_217 [Oryctes borbonicus]|uniref:SAP domain-containing protein n=1 Tax=Oryctes borbonicus TaxID=1629725 RepID=A0A0T6B9I1_9SCAR|nr:hypothetical protein AMK59_217 [Oryctes borbonicus]